MTSQDKPSAQIDLPGESLRHDQNPDLQHTLQRALKLTPRQSQVCLLISGGRTNARIAELLAISKRTVDKHMEQILEKLEVKNRIAVTYLVQQQLSGGEDRRDQT